MFLGDDDLWNNFKKFVTKIDNSNTETPFKIKRAPKFFRTQSQNLESKIVYAGKSFNHIEIEQLDKKKRKHFASEASLDLHGKTLTEVDKILENFCSKCIASRIKEINIITGKGEGIVKKATLEWIKNNSKYIIGFFEIKDLKGEVGSFGIRLRSVSKMFLK